MGSEMCIRDSEIRVRDKGGGIPTSDRDRVFEPFFRGMQERASEHRGAGLGLAIARDIARRHGGDVALATTDEPGASFLATLPPAPRGVGA